MTSAVDDGTEYVPFGPGGGTLPAAFTSRVNYANGYVLTLRASFDGRRVRVDALTLEAANGGITPALLVDLQLGQVIQRAAQRVVTPSKLVAAETRDRGVTDEQLGVVADIYWFHHVTWGEPRRAVMSLWNVSRTTANRWLRRCRELYDMPEVE